MRETDIESIAAAASLLSLDRIAMSTAKKRRRENASTRQRPRVAPLSWSRCRAGKGNDDLGRRQVWLGTDFAGLLCASIERFPENGSRVFMIILDLVEAGDGSEPIIVSRVMGTTLSLKRGKAEAARLVARIGNVKRYEKPAPKLHVS